MPLSHVNLILTVLSAGLILAQTSAPPEPNPIRSEPDFKLTAEELVAHECALNIGASLPMREQRGPVFASENIAFTSTMARDASHLLVITAGRGIFAAKLANEGINRIRFTLKTATGDKKEFFLSYMHGGVSRAKVFEFSEGQPPMNRENIEFQLVALKRAPYLRKHLEFATFETADTIISDLLDGRIGREEIKIPESLGCERIVDVKHKAATFEMLLVGPTSVQAARRPASN